MTHSSSVSLKAPHVLVTRQYNQASEFVDVLHEQGASVSVMPVTYLQSITTMTLLSKEVITEYDWLVLTSANAAEQFFLATRDVSWKTYRDTSQLKIAVIGNKTAQVVRDEGLTIDFIPNIQRASMFAQELVTNEKFCSKTKVLFPCAKNARRELPDILEQSGAVVDRLVLYSMETSSKHNDDIIEGCSILHNGHVDIISCFAPSQVYALKELLGNQAINVINRCPIVAAIGPTTAHAMHELDITANLVSSSPDAMVFASEILALWNQRMS